MYQKNYPNQTQKQPVIPPPLPPKPKYRFRWGIFVAAPLVLLLFIWLGKNVKLSFEFEDIVELLQIEHIDNYTRLAALMVLCIAFILIVKLFKNHSDP